MSGRVVIDAVGAAVEIDVSALAPSSIDAVRTAWKDALITHPGEADAVVTPRDVDDAAMLSRLSTDVTLAALEHRRGQLWMVHAAGLADERGRVVVLSAPSGTGKTTAARHLAQRFAYVSDETVGIDSQGGVVPYRKPLSVLVPGKGRVKAQHAVSSITGERELSAALRLAKIVVLDRRDDAGDEARVEPLDLADALAALAPQSSYLPEMRAPLRTIAALLDATGGAVRIVYRDVEAIDAIIDGFMGAEPSAQTEPAWAATKMGETSSTEPTDDHWSRAPTADVLALGDGRLAVLRRADNGGRLDVLDGIAPAIWEAADGTSTASIRDAVLAKFGDPGDGINAHATVRDALVSLRDRGIVV